MNRDPELNLGVRVVVTRAASQADGLVETLQTLGLTPHRLPLLEILPPADPRPLARAATELPLYDWVAFTSANAVEALLSASGGLVPSRIRVASIGAATSAALADFEINPDLEAKPSTAESLAESMAPFVGRQRRILLPQAEDARPVLADGLRQAGAEVVPILAYSKRCPANAAQEARELFSQGPIGWVTFTSPRIVRTFVDLLGKDWIGPESGLLPASIGPVTSGALRDAGFEPVVEAALAREEDLANAIDASVRSSL